MALLRTVSEARTNFEPRGTVESLGFDLDACIERGVASVALEGLHDHREREIERMANFESGQEEIEEDFAYYRSAD